jgi:dolichol-phosphate mannosyltransferase
MTEVKAKQFVSSVLYIFNNKENLQTFFPTLIDTLTKNFENHEIICVDDGSEDGSVEFVREFMKNLPDHHTITVVKMGRHQGVEFSMNAGADLAIGDMIFEFDTIDADFDKKFIMEAFCKNLAGYDIVSAVPRKTCGFFSQMFYRVYNWGGGGELYRVGFRVVSRRALNRIKATNCYIPYRKALYAKSGLAMTKIYYNSDIQRKKEYTDERMGLALEVLILFTETVQKISLFISLFFAFIAIGVGVYIVMAYFGTRKPVEGWTPIMGFLVLGFFGMFLLFSLVFEYLSVILRTVFIKQRYAVESVEKL